MTVQCSARMRGFAAGLLAATLSILVTAMADDRSAGVALPGLMVVPADSVQATAAQLAMRGDEVELRLSLQQKRNHAELFIRGPRFGWLGEAEPYPERQFPELRATLGDAELAVDDGFLAFVGERNITAEIRKAGFDPFTIAQDPPFVDPPVEGSSGRAAFYRLVAEHAVEKSDDHFLARWTAQRLLRFKLGDSPRPTVSIFYKARPGFALVTWDSLSRRVSLKSYCVTATELRKRLATDVAPGESLPELT